MTQAPGPSDHTLANTDRLLTVPQTADYLGVSTKFVYLLVASGDLAGVRVGRFLRVRQSALLDYVQVHSTDPS